jgi:hypothetical protein
LEGCQRVIEPDLSPLLYKSKPLQGYDHGIATKYCFKDKGTGLTFPNLILFFSPEVRKVRKSERKIQLIVFNI